MNSLKIATGSVLIILVSVFLSGLSAKGQPKMPVQTKKPEISGAYLKAFLAISKDARYKKWVYKNLDRYNINFSQNKDVYYVTFKLNTANHFGGEIWYVVRKRDMRVIRNLFFQ